MIDPDPVLTLQEAADRLRVHRRTLHKWITAGRGPPLVKFSRRKVGIRSSDLKDYLASFVTQPGEAAPPGRLPPRR